MHALEWSGFALVASGIAWGVIALVSPEWAAYSVAASTLGR